MMDKKQEYKVTKPMYNPPHPGAVIRDAVIDALNLTIKDAAEHLDVDRITLSRVINGRAAVSVEMAMRLAQALNTTPNVWLTLQQNYDLAQVRNGSTDFSRVRRFESIDHHAPTV